MRLAAFSLVALVALVALACTSAERKGDVTDSGKGIPVGYKATERSELRTGEWRFYRIVARDAHREPREDNLVLRDVTRMSGDEAIAAFVLDQRLREQPDGLPPSRFAEQVAMFLVRGPAVTVAEDPLPDTRLVDDVLIHRSWLVMGDVKRQLVVEVAADGKAKSELKPAPAPAP
jgi:hypothetical protein